MNEDSGSKWVTNAELKAEIDKLPTRWEVRFLVVAALVAGRFIPTQITGGAQAAAHAVTGVLM